MDELNEQKLQKLLQLKKQETPGKEYFDGFLAEFHNYQRAELLRETTQVKPFFGRLRELFVWEPRHALMASGALAVVVILLALSLFSNGSITKQGQATQFAKINVQPNVNVQLVSEPITGNGPAPHYATGQTPLSYDKTIAF